MGPISVQHDLRFLGLRMTGSDVQHERYCTGEGLSEHNQKKEIYNTPLDELFV
jgi:hypothetical protein